MLHHLAERQDIGSSIPIGIGILLLELPCNCVGIRQRRPHRGSILETGHAVKPVVAPLFFALLGRLQGNPELRRLGGSEVEVARKHAHDRGGSVVEGYVLPNDIGAAAIVSLPGAIAQQGDSRRADGVSTGGKIASEKGRDTQRAEKSSANACNWRHPRAQCCRDGRVAASIDVERSEDGIEPFPIEIVLVR
jgi:hypothetical protein